jgi:hypothetical protein
VPVFKCPSIVFDSYAGSSFKLLGAARKEQATWFGRSGIKCGPPGETPFGSPKCKKIIGYSKISIRDLEKLLHSLNQSEFE